jgi:hypothetical protein
MPKRRHYSAAFVILGLLAGFVHAADLEFVAQYGRPAPAGRGNYRVFGILDGYSPAISGGNVAFGAITDGASGIYALMDGEVIVIADQLTQMPDRDLPFRFALSRGSGPSISGRNVAFVGVVIAEGEAIWTWIDGKLRRIADTSTPVPGGIGTFRNFASGNGARPSISGENVAFAGGWPREGNMQLGHGIYAYINGELRKIADTETRMPGSNQKPLNFRLLDGISPSISGENVVFSAVMPEGSTITLFAYIDGELQFIVDSRTPRPGGEEGQTLGGTAGHPDICGENIVFTTASGVYAYIDGQLEVVADDTMPAPGAKGNFLYFGGAGTAGSSISGKNVTFAASAERVGSGIYARINGKLRLIANELTRVPGREDLTFQGFSWANGVAPDISGETVVFEGTPPDGIYISPAAPGVPAISRWGMIVTALIILTAAAGILRIVRASR